METMVQSHYREALKRAGHLAQAADHHGALAAYDEAIRLAPCRADAHYEMGLLHHKLGQVAEAIVCFERAAELVPDDATVWNNLGVLHYSRNDVTQAERVFRQALSLDERYGDAWYGLAKALQGQGREAQATHALHICLHWEPHHSRVLQPSHVLRGLIEEAEDICSRVKNDAVLGRYFTRNNPWAGRPWREFDYWNGWYALAKLRRPERILEIGTAFGFSTIALARGAGEGLTLLVSLDLGNFGSLFRHEGSPEMDNLNYVLEGILRYRQEHGLDFRYSQFRVNTQPAPYTDNQGNPVDCPYWRENRALMRLLDQTRFDLILIDGKHTGDRLYNDLISFFDYANPGCLIVCDDLQNRDPIAALTRFVRPRRSEIADYCIWRYLHSNAAYRGSLRRDQGLLLKGSAPGSLVR